MKVKRLISALCAAVMSVSAFAGLSAQAADAGTYETIYEDDFSSSSATVTREAGVGSSSIENGELVINGGTGNETFHINFPDNKSYSVNDASVFKMTFDAKASSLSRFGVGLGDGTKKNGAYWTFGMVTAGSGYTAQGLLAMGGAAEDTTNKYLIPLKDTDGNTKTAVKDTWYSVEAYIAFPSMRMTTTAWAKNDPSVVYTYSVEPVPANYDYSLGRSKATSISAVRFLSRAVSVIDNIKVERMVLPTDGNLLWADYDAIGSTPSDEVASALVTKSIATEGTNKYLELSRSWGSTYYKLSETISQSSTCNIETSFDVKFSTNSRNGIGIGGDSRDNGSFWILAYTQQGLQIGSVDDNQTVNRVLLRDSAGNTLTPDTTKWYRVESKIELPSKKMETKLYAKDEEDPTVYSASGDMFAYGNYIVGGMKPNVDITRLRLFTGSTPMSIDNISVEKTIPPFSAASAVFNGTDIDVTFNYEISNASAITLNGQATNGTLSEDKKTYTIPASDLETGVYTVTVPAGLAADNGQTIAEDVVFSVNVIDSLTIGFHPFTDGTDNGKTLNVGGLGSNWASIEQDEDGNYYMHATKGTEAASDDQGNYRYWQYISDNSALDTYWNETAAYKYLKIEFDIRTNAVPTGLERIYFSKMHKYHNGLQIFGMNADTVAMGEPETARAFTEIKNLTPGSWYHYTYILDINNKRARAVLSDGTNEYKVDWKSLSGSGQGYWKDSLVTPFDTLAFQLPGGDIDLDNITFKKYYEVPTVNADSITFISDDEIQTDWSKVSTSTNQAVIDFATTMNEETVNNDTVYITKKGDTQKLDAVGTFSDGKYVLALNETLAQNTEYELCITTGVKNAAGATFGTEDYVAVFTTAAGELKAAISSVKDAQGNAVETFTSLCELLGQKININISYTNTTEQDGEYNIIVAHFNGKALVKAEIINVSKTADITYAEDSVEYTVPSDMSSITSTALYLWNNMTDIKPLSEPVIY